MTTTTTSQTPAPAAPTLSDSPAPWPDTREWIGRATAAGQLRVVRGANWQSEIGEIAEMLDHTDELARASCSTTSPATRPAGA